MRSFSFSLSLALFLSRSPLTRLLWSARSGWPTTSITMALSGNMLLLQAAACRYYHMLHPLDHQMIAFTTQVALWQALHKLNAYKRQVLVGHSGCDTLYKL